MKIIEQPLHLNPYHFRYLLEQLGPSLGFWRAAEVAALREQSFPAPVLDLGCGDGFITALVLPGADTGLDPDARALRSAQQRGLYRQVEANPVEESTLPPGSAATILSNSVLEHLPHINQALAAVARLLRPGGRLILTAPTPAFSRSLLLSNRSYAERRNRALQHLNLWPLEEWRERLCRAGLEIELARPYLRPGLVRLWDALELLQQPQVNGIRPFGRLWRTLPSGMLDRLAHLAARTDLSAPLPGCGCLIAARKPAG